MQSDDFLGKHRANARRFRNRVGVQKKLKETAALPLRQVGFQKKLPQKKLPKEIALISCSHSFAQGEAHVGCGVNTTCAASSSYGLLSRH